MKYFFPITLFFILGCNKPILDTDRSIFIQKLDALKFLSKYHDQLHIMIGEEKGDADKAFKEFSNALRANNNSELIYKGAIDDNYKSYKDVTNFYIIDAINNMINKQPLICIFIKIINFYLMF